MTGWEGEVLLRYTCSAAAGDRNAEATSPLSGRWLVTGYWKTEGANVAIRTGQGIQPPLSRSAPVSWLGCRFISAFGVGCVSALTPAAGGYVRIESLGPDEGILEGGDIRRGGD